MTNPVGQHHPLLRQLPAVEEVLQDSTFSLLLSPHPRALRKRAVQQAVASARRRLPPNSRGNASASTSARM